MQIVGDSDGFMHKGSGKRVISGNSDNGGASYMNWNDNANNNVGFRPLITSRECPQPMLGGFSFRLFGP